MLVQSRVILFEEHNIVEVKTRLEVYTVSFLVSFILVSMRIDGFVPVCLMTHDFFEILEYDSLFLTCLHAYIYIR